MKAYGGDRIMGDGYEGIVRGTRYSLMGEGTTYEVRTDQGADVRIREETATVVAYAQHDYIVGGTHRGHCRHCGVAKKEHE